MGLVYAALHLSSVEWNTPWLSSVTMFIIINERERDQKPTFALGMLAANLIDKANRLSLIRVTHE